MDNTLEKPQPAELLSLKHDEKDDLKISSKYHAQLARSRRSRAMSVISGQLEEPGPPEHHIKFPSCRLVLTLMGVLASVNCYTTRVNLSVALVVMVNNSWVASLSGGTETTGHLSPCVGQYGNQTVEKMHDGHFKWDASMQGVVLSSFYYGYVTTTLVGGILALKFGGKVLLMFAVGWTSALSIITPPLTIVGDAVAMIVVRVLEGVGQGVAFPAFVAMLAKWAPPREKSTMTAAMFAGAQLGVVIGYIITGYMTDDLGWESSFYFFGGLGMVWSLAFWFLVYESPDDHPRIQKDEHDYIEEAMGSDSPDKSKSMHAPWKSMMKSMPVHALSVAHFVCMWGIYTNLSCLPQYYLQILAFNVDDIGLLSAVPFIAMWVTQLGTGLTADLIKFKHKKASLTLIRKVCVVGGFVLSGVCTVLIGYVGCHKIAAVALVILSTAFIGVSSAAVLGVNQLDLSPKYAGIIMGITNTVATIAGFIGPSVVGAFTDGNITISAWRGVFWVTGGIMAFGAVFYSIFGSGKQQPWGMGQTMPSK